MNDYNYYNNDSVAVLMDNMFKCKNEIHVVKPLLKLLHDNNAIPRANYKGINDGLQGFDTNLNEENKLYNNLVQNVQFRPNNNNEKNLIKLLADVYRKFDLSEEVLQSVILSWLVTNKEYNSSCNLINDSNKLHSLMMEYSQKKHGRVMVKHGGSSLKEMVTEMFTLYNGQKLTYNDSEIIEFNKNTLIYHLLKNIKVTDFKKDIIFKIDEAKKELIDVLALINADLLNNKMKSTHLLIFTDDTHLKEWNTFTDIIIDNVTNYLSLNGLDDVFKTIYHTIKNEHVPTEFSKHWNNVKEIIDKIKNNNITGNVQHLSFPLLNIKGGNKNSYVNKAVINNMLIGGIGNMLNLVNINFANLAEKLNKELKSRGYTLLPNDVIELKKLAKDVDDALLALNKDYIKYYINSLNEKMKKIPNDKTYNEVNINDYLSKFYDNKIDKSDSKDFEKNLKIFLELFNNFNSIVNQTPITTDQKKVRLINKITDLNSKL